MKRSQWVLAAILLVVFGAAWADGGGTIYRNGTATALTVDETGITLESAGP